MGEAWHAQSEALLDWLRVHGAQFEQLAMRHCHGEHRAVHAKREIAKGETLLRVPLDCIMTLSRARAAPLCQHVERSGCPVSTPHTWLALFVLEEKRKGPDSFWQPYLSLLPTAYRNMPQYFEPRLLSLLQGSFTVETIAARKRQLRQEYQRLATHYPAFGRIFSLLDFEWARLVVITRIFSFMVQGQEEEGLVPLADMLNHARHPQTSWQFQDSLTSASSSLSSDSSPSPPSSLSSSSSPSSSSPSLSSSTSSYSSSSSSSSTSSTSSSTSSSSSSSSTSSAAGRDDNSPIGFFCIRAVRNIARGEEIFDSYGRKCNWRFFVNYGFTLLDNQEDNQARVTLPSVHSLLHEPPATWWCHPSPASPDPLLGIKQNMLRDQTTCQLSMAHQEANCRSAFAFLRLALVPPAFTLLFSPAHRNAAGASRGQPRVHAFCPWTELRVLWVMAEAARRALAQFTTSSKHDTALLQQHEQEGQALELRERDCIVMRRGEKQVLEYFVHLYPRTTQALFGAEVTSPPAPRRMCDRTAFLAQVDKIFASSSASDPSSSSALSNGTSPHPHSEKTERAHAPALSAKDESQEKEMTNAEVERNLWRFGRAYCIDQIAPLLPNGPA
eukprot:g45711.t1